VTVNSNDANGLVIPNVASFTDVNTASCGGAPTCDTNPVKVTVAVPQSATNPQQPTTTTSTTVDPTTTTVGPTTTTIAHALAFTGTNAARTLVLALVAVVAGLGLLGLSRRRRPRPAHARRKR
jgi:hypothetical protein